MKEAAFTLQTRAEPSPWRGWETPGGVGPCWGAGCTLGEGVRSGGGGAPWGTGCALEEGVRSPGGHACWAWWEDWIGTLGYQAPGSDPALGGKGRKGHWGEGQGKRLLPPAHMSGSEAAGISPPPASTPDLGVGALLVRTSYRGHVRSRVGTAAGKGPK